VQFQASCKAQGSVIHNPRDKGGGIGSIILTLLDVISTQALDRSAQVWGRQAIASIAGMGAICEGVKIRRQYGVVDSI
jgi:hypothetical protein